MKLTLRQRLALIIALAALIPAVIIALIAYSANRSVTDRFALDAGDEARQAVANLDAQILAAKDQLVQIARLIEAPPLVQGQDADAMTAVRESPQRLATARFVRVISATQVTFPVLMVTDRNRLTYADGSPGTMEEFGQMAPFQLLEQEILKEGFAISQGSAGTGDNSAAGFWVQVALRPPAAAEGSAPVRQPTHFLSGFFPVEKLVETLRRETIEGVSSNETGYFLLLDPNGSVVADSLPAAAPAADTRAGADGSLTVPAAALTTDETAPPAAQPPPASKTTGRAVAKASSALTDYAVQAVLDPARVSRSHDGQGASLLWLLLGIGALATLIAIPLAKNFLAPIYKLLEAARAWQAGDSKFLLRGATDDGEWSELYESMNGLAARSYAVQFNSQEPQPAPVLPATVEDSPLIKEVAQAKSLLRAATETESEGILVTDESGRPIFSNSVFWEIWEKIGLRQGALSTNGARRKLPMLKLLRQTTRPRANLRRLRDLAAQPALKLSGQVDLKDNRRLQFSVRPFLQAEVVKGRIWRFRDISARSRLEEELRTSKQLMDNLVENLPLALFVKDVRDEFRIILWNRASEEMFGVARIRAIGKPGGDIEPPDLAAALAEHDLEALRQGGPIEVSHQHLPVSPKGARLLRVVKVPIYDATRMASHLFCLAEDITERNHTEQRLRTEHSLLRGLIDSLPDLISFKSHAGVYLGCNRAFEEFTGMTETHFLGHTDKELFPGLELSLPPQIDREILTEAQPRWRAAELNLPDGRTAHLNTVETPLRGPLGEVWGILAVSQVAAITDASGQTVFSPADADNAPGLPEPARPVPK